MKRLVYWIARETGRVVSKTLLALVMPSLHVELLYNLVENMKPPRLRHCGWVAH